jgi:hypothetical protein
MYRLRVSQSCTNVNRRQLFMLDSISFVGHQSTVEVSLPAAMRTRTIPKSRSWRLALRGLLAAYVACFVGGERLLGFAHLAFSDHRHAFCEEHGQFEDLPKSSASAREASAPSSPDWTARGALASTFVAHTACLFLNGRTFQAPLQLTAQVPIVAPANQLLDQLCSRQDGVPVCPLLLSAPKTSPPFRAA